MSKQIQTARGQARIVPQGRVAPRKGKRAISLLKPIESAPASPKSKRGQRSVDIHMIDAAPAGGGHSACDSQKRNVPSGKSLRHKSRGHGADDNHLFDASAPRTEGGPRAGDTQFAPAPLSPTISLIRELWHRRQYLHRSEKGLTLQIKDYCRHLCPGRDKTLGTELYNAIVKCESHPKGEIALATVLPIIEARSGIEASRKETEKQLEKLAKQLPVSEFVESTLGFGYLGLAGIVGECGDLAIRDDPKNPNVTVSQLWKRMGLAVIDGQRQRRIKGAEAIKQGYSPMRRSLMWTLGESLIKSQLASIKDDDGEKIGRKAKGPYGKLYIAYRERDEARDHSGTAREIAARLRSRGYKEKEIPKPNLAGTLTPMHFHNRAKRYVEKRLLRDLWRAWRAANGGMSSTVNSPPANLLAAE